MDQSQRTLGAGLAADAAAGPATDATSTALPPALMSPAVLARLIAKQDVRAVKALLAAGLDPNTPDPATGMLSILMAAGNNDIAMLTALLEAGADINAPTNSAGTTTTLSYAVANCGLSTIKAMLDAGANPNVQGEEGGTVLMEAILCQWEEVALMLVTAGAHVNPTDGSIPPLHAAALQGQVRVVSALLAAGASPTSGHRIQDAAHQSHSTAARASHQETGQSTAAHIAHSAVQAQVPVTLGEERGAAGGHSDTGAGGQSAHSQARTSHLQALSLIVKRLSHLAPDGPTALDMAAAASRSAVLAVMLSQQPRPSAQALSNALACSVIPASQTPARATPKGSHRQKPAPIQDHCRAMELLIDAGADPNLSYLSAEAGALMLSTPLMTAAMRGELAPVRLLLRAGADVNTVGHDGETALSIACMLGHAAVVKELLSAGAPLKADSNDQFVQACKGNSAEVFDLLLAAGMEVALDSRGTPPLVKAAFLGADAVVGRLLSGGAPIEQMDESGVTALYYASTLTIDAWAQGRLRALKVLLAAGADPNARQGLYRPLSTAAASGNAEAVRLLLAGGAEFSVAHRGGRTPLQVAAAAGHEGVVSVLLAAGADPRPALASVEAGAQLNTRGALGVRKLLREACARLDAAALADRLAAELIAQEQEEERGRGGSTATGGQGTRKRKGKGRPKGCQSQQPAAIAAPGMAVAAAAAVAPAPAAAAAAAVPGDSGGRSGSEVVVEGVGHVHSAGVAVVEGGGHIQSAAVPPVAASGRVDAASPTSSPLQLEEVQALALSFSQQAALHEGLTGGCTGQVAGGGGLDSWCVVCMERRHNTVLVPCAHAVLCTDCCAAVQAANNQCPMCREPIEAVLQLQV